LYLAFGVAADQGVQAHVWLLVLWDSGSIRAFLRQVSPSPTTPDKLVPDTCLTRIYWSASGIVCGVNQTGHVQFFQGIPRADETLPTDDPRPVLRPPRRAATDASYLGTSDG